MIALFGGSFDPFHNGHLSVIKHALIHIVSINKLIVMPAYQAPMKSISLLSTKKRFSQVKASIKHIDNCWASDWEIGQKRAVYTYETVNILEKEYLNQQVALLLGDDQFMQLNKWNRYEKLLERCPLFVFPRHHSQESCESYHKNILKQVGVVTYVPMPVVALSSTDIREKIVGKKSEKVTSFEDRL